MVVYLMLGLVVVLCLMFTFTNGFQDGSSVAANALACRAMSKREAVIVVAVFEFFGAIFGGSAVAHSIRGITSWPARPDLLTVLASGLTAAIVWNFAMRRLGVPSSSTHAFVGGLIGAVIAGCGGTQYLITGDWGMLIHPTGIWRVILSLFLSPIVGFALSYIVLAAATKLLVNASSSLNEPLKRLQWLSVPLLAFGHGANDTQKVMGVIALSLSAAGFETGGGIPVWVRLSTAAAMSMGVAALAPGIVKRVGSIYRQRPLHGLVTESVSALIVSFASLTGGPLAASQVIASTVVGAGSADRIKGVQWAVTRDMMRTWLLTIPCSAVLAWLLHCLIFTHLNRFL